MACGKTCNVYVGIFRIIGKLVFEIVSHLNHTVVHELDVEVFTEREAIRRQFFYFGDRFCYVNESRALELYSHTLTQLLFLTRLFFLKAIHFSFLFFWVGGSGTQYYKTENLK